MAKKFIINSILIICIFAIIIWLVVQTYQENKINEKTFGNYNNENINITIVKQKNTLKTNVLLAEIIEQMISSQEKGKTVQQLVGQNTQSFVDQINKKLNYKEKINQLKQRDFNKYEMSGILLTMCIYIVLLFVKELVGNHYLINYYIDLLVAVIMLCISVKQLLNQRNLIKRYQVSTQPFIVEIISIIISLLIAILFYNSPFDITFVILVIAFFTSKKMYSKSLNN